MKKIFLAAVIALTCHASVQAQSIFNKVKDKAKDKLKTEAENLASNKQQSTSTNTSNNTNTKEQKTAQPPVDNYTKMDDEAYIKALSKKANQSMAVKDLQGTNGYAINDYYNHAAEFDLAHFYPVMQKKGKPSGLDGVSDYEEIMKVRNEYPQTYDTKFKLLIDGTIEGAYTLKKTNKLEAVANLQAAMHLNEACLLILPDLKSALEMKAELDKAYAAIGGEQAKVFTSEFHKQNVGKILFSREPIVVGKEKPSQFISSFGANENIYAMVYLSGTIRELCGVREGDNNVLGEYRIKLDGQDISGLTYLDFRHNKEDWNNAWFPIEVRPDPAVAVHGLDATYFAGRFADLSPRKHTFGIYFSMPNNYNEPFAYGEIKLDWTAGDTEKMKADAKVAVAKAQTNYAKTVKLSPAFSQPNHVFQDPALSVANLKKAFLAGTPDAVQVLKLITIKERSSEDWTINRNDYGVIFSKSTNHFTSFVFKAKDGNCYIHEVGQFVRVATGGGSYGNLVLNPTGLIDERIACENVK